MRFAVKSHFGIALWYQRHTAQLRLLVVKVRVAAKTIIKVRVEMVDFSNPFWAMTKLVTKMAKAQMSA